MSALVLHPTEVAQWHALIQQAEMRCGKQLADDLESYLVFLLQRFITRPDIADRMLALDYLEGHAAVGREKQALLREVGDCCLLYAGFFPRQVERRSVGVSYFVDLGQGAYDSLATAFARGHISLAELFSSLSIHFVGLMDLLQDIRELEERDGGLTPLQAEELWRKTGSERALRVLQRYVRGVPLTRGMPDAGGIH